METITTSGLTLHFDQKEIDVVDQIVDACNKSIQTIHESWRLETPRDCRVYILSSWPRCVFLGAPPGAQLLLGLTLPLWYSEFKQRWYYSGGWSQSYGQRQVVGIKSPRLIAEIPGAFGESIFMQEDDLKEKVLSIVCHELTHAFSSHLQLPSWMNEGLAMVSADRCLGKPTVLPETLQMLKNGDAKQRTISDLKLKSQSRDEVILLYVRGYWHTRYLADNYPDMVINLLKNKRDQQEMESLLASLLKIPQESYCQAMDEMVYQAYHFELT